MNTPKPGTIGWIDLTVPDATGLRDFYKAVAGWSSIDIDMDGYADYAMVPPGADDAVAGVCHRRGPNANVPPSWLIYITVPDLEASLKTCLELGGTLIDGPRDGFCIIRDPAGAVCGLIQPATEEPGDPS